MSYQPVNSYTRVENGPTTTITRTSQRQLLNPRNSSVMVSQHTHYQNTDNLYRPLKETIAHPEVVRSHADYIPQATQSSMVSKQYRRLDTKDLSNIEKNTYIPDAQLVPTDHLEKVRDEKFVAVDATQRVAGQPISQEQMDRIRAQGFKQSRVVYEVQDPEVEVRETRIIKEEKAGGGVIIDEPVRETRVEKVEKVSYAPATYDTYGTRNYKYNAFSCIDQPVNECRVLGCGKCHGCPANQGIARENHPPSILRP